MTRSTISLSILLLVAALLYSGVAHAGTSGDLAAITLMGVDPAVMKPTSPARNVSVSAMTTIQLVRAGLVGPLRSSREVSALRRIWAASNDAASIDDLG